MRQLTLHGFEVELRWVGRTRRLTPAQREVLAVIGREGEIRSRHAGLILHSHRPNPKARYYASDGSDMLRRLEARGLVRRTGRRGRWTT